MIRKSGNRFSEKDHAPPKNPERQSIQSEAIGALGRPLFEPKLHQIRFESGEGAIERAAKLFDGRGRRIRRCLARGGIDQPHAQGARQRVLVGDKWREEPWWTSSGTLRLLLYEYVKYVAAVVRVQLEAFGIDLTFEGPDQPAAISPPRRPATAQAN